jgi:sarcosine oxidase subunit gamma
MSEAIRAESPLVERITPERKSGSPSNPGVTFRSRPFWGYVNLRGHSGDQAFVDAVEGVLGGKLPVEPNTISEGKGVRAYWLGPNEWLLVTGQDGQIDLRDRLEAALTEVSSAVCDVTGYYTAIELEGPNARDALEKGCTLDMHPRVFLPGQCAQTLLSHAIIVLRPTSATGDGFEIIARRSFADYVFVYLEDAAEEFGMAVTD